VRVYHLLNKKCVIMVQMTHENVENVTAIQALNSSIQSLDLFGRNGEQEQLGAIYQQFKKQQQQSDGPSQLVLIHGASGTGKSALVEHVFQKTSQRDGVYCITGGFDQLMHVQQPHAAFVDALTSLVQLVKERNQMDLFRHLTYRLEEMDVLVKMIPAIADAMKPTEAAKMEAELSAIHVTTLLGSQNSKEMASRFKYAILQFLRAVAAGMGQIMLVLEDIHRADEPALDLLSSLLYDSANRSIMFVATYRDESNTDVLDTFLKKLPSRGSMVTHIPLQNLDSASAADMIKSLLQIDRWCMYDNALVDFVLKQTKGNPYFILICLRTLVEEGLLRYNPSSIPTWQCDSEELRIEFGETIVDILRRKISSLPPMALEAIRFASFLGSKVNLEIVSYLVGETEAVVVSSLQLAAEKGLLLHHETRGWSFSHDSIQDAIMNVVPENEREQFHYQIGRRLWKCFDIDELDDNIFVVVGQLLAGKQYIVVERERTAVAKLCLRACERSVFVSSFHSAYDYVLNGIDLLGTKDWRENYDFTLSLYNAAVELAYCTGHPKDALKFAEIIISQSRCFEDSLHGLTMKVRTLGSIGNVDECVEFGLNVLSQLGEKFPSSPGMVRCYIELRRIRYRVKRKTSETLLRLPLMTNERKLAAVHLLNQLFMYCCQNRPFLAPLLGFRVVSLTLDFGISTTSCLGFVALGAILSG
jgi:predicted ATPase